MHRYKTWNGPMPTTTAQAAVATGTSIKTMLQLATPSTRQIQLIAWGFSIDDPAGADGVIELLDGDVAASAGTAHVAAGLQPLNPGSPASLLTTGTAATGYTFGTENTITAARVHDVVPIAQVGAAEPAFFDYRYQFMPYERPVIAVSRFVRVRATVPTSGVDLRCWIAWEE